MKKITLLIVLLATIGWQGMAQTYVQENFDTGIPVAWTVVDGGTTIDTWSSGMVGANNLDGTNGAVVNSDAAGNGNLLVETMVSPIFNSSAATTLYLDFDQYYNGAGSDTAMVEVFDGTNWVPVLTQDGSDIGSFATPNQQHIDITAYKNANMQVRFYYSDNNVWAWYWMIDNVQIYNSTCAQPTGLAVSNVLANSVDLTWIESGIATTWDIEWGFLGFPASGTPNISGTTTNPHNLSGLNPTTMYDFYVRADCGGSGTSIWAGPYTFTTACATVTAPFFDDVEAHATTTNFATSNCWSATATSSYDWNIDGAGSTPSGGTGPTAAFSGTNYFYIEASGAVGGAVAELYSPNVDITALTVPALEFQYHMTGAQIGTLFVDVFDGTWTTVDSIIGQQQAAQADPWLKRTIDLSAFGGTIQVRFRAIAAGTFAGDISIDDINFREAPTCFDPTTLGANNILATSADLFWTETGTATAWDIEWGTAGFVPTGTPTITGTTTNPHSLTGLTAITSYDFYVRSECGVNGSSAWIGPFSFTTACATTLAPWLDDVEAHATTTALSSSNCWTATSVSAYDWNIDGAGSTPSTGTGPLAAFSGTNYFYIEASSGAAGDEAQLVSPVIDLSALTVPALKYYYHMTGTVMGNLYVDVFDGTWNTIDSLIGQQQAAQGDAWLSKTLNLSAFTGIVQIRFRAVSAGTFAGDISIDDIEVLEAPSCFDPSNLAVTNLLGTSVDLNWNENGTATTWDIEWGTTGFVPTGTPTITGTTTNPHSLTGLTPVTSYDYYVRADCGGGNGTSLWIGPFTFTTTVTCPAPSALNAVSITSSSADLAWTENGVANSWEIEHGATGFVQGTGTFVITGTNPHNLTGLTSATTYDFYVRAVCGPADSSLWDGPYTFTTACTVFMAPYAQNFDNNTTPTCWSQSAITGGPWVFGQLGSTGYASAIFDDNTGNGGYFAWLDFSGTDVAVVLEMPDVDVTSLINTTVSFDMASYNNDNNDSNILFVEAWDGTVWQQVAMIEQDSSLWVSHSYSLTGMTYGANLVKVRFRAEEDANQVSDFYNDLLIDNVLIDGTVSVTEIENAINVNVYPNPNNGVFTLAINTLEITELEIKVINIQGQVVFVKNNFDNVSNINEQIDLSDNAKGIYFLSVTTDKGIKTHKIIVQ